MAEDRMAVLDTLRKALASGDVDFLREGVRVLAQAVMETEVTELTGVPRGERDPDARLTHRNGYRARPWDTRVGTIDLAIPRVRDGRTSRACSTRVDGPNGPFSPWSARHTWRASRPGGWMTSCARSGSPGSARAR